MRYLYKVVRPLTDGSKWIGIFTMAFSMFFITFATVSRTLFNAPILGDIEIVQLSMVVLIMFGLAYCEKEGAHIAIEFFVERFSPRVQAVFDMIAHVLTCVVCLLIGWFFIRSGMDNMTNNYRATDLLRIPLFPLKFIIAFGYMLWGLESFCKLVHTIAKLIRNEFTIADSSKEGETP